MGLLQRYKGWKDSRAAAAEAEHEAKLKDQDEVIDAVVCGPYGFRNTYTPLALRAMHLGQ